MRQTEFVDPQEAILRLQAALSDVMAVTEVSRRLRFGQGIVFAGRLMCDPKSTLPVLQQRFAQLGYTPFLKRERGEDLVIARFGVIRPRLPNPLVNLILFLVAISQDNPDEFIKLFSVFMGLFAVVGVVTLMQSVIVGEKQSGTAAWLLSKPASRKAFVLAKLAANVAGITVSIVIAQGLVAYLIYYFDEGVPLPPLAFVAALGVHWVNLLFYLTLTMMLGTFSDRRGAVIGVPLALLVAEFGVMMFFPNVGRFLPWVLAIPPDSSESIAMSVMTGTEPLTCLPIVTATVASVLFTVIALWAFERQEL